MTRRLAGLLIAALVATACGERATTAPPTPDLPSMSALSEVPRTAPPSEPAPPSAALLGSPPMARLAVEGGDPVEGQLGTYTWAGGGSDAPWLPGAPIVAASGEPMAIAFEPAIGIAGWRARIVPAAADGPAGARLLAEGTGTPRFEAPEPGAWTLEVQVTFAAGMGAASYAWALSVS